MSCNVGKLKHYFRLEYVDLYSLGFGTTVYCVVKKLVQPKAVFL